VRRRGICNALTVALFVLLAASSSAAQKCIPPTAEKRMQVENYVLAKYKLGSAADLVLTGDLVSNDACYWTFHYQPANGNRPITVSLSPEGNYLMPMVFDLRVDPQVEEKAARARIEKDLLAGTAPELGAKDSAVTLVEFADFECPYCKRMADVMRKDILAAPDSRVRFVFRQFPLPLHPWAMQAAKMAECVTLQKPDRFWKVHDFLFDNQSQLTAENLKEKVYGFVAGDADIDQTQYRFCVDNELALGLVNRDIDLGKKLGVQGTPALFINGSFFPGFKDAAQLRAILEQIAAGKEPDLAESVPRDSSTTVRASCGGGRAAQLPR
jgi:protein-disulfide isomerase